MKNLFKTSVLLLSLLMSAFANSSDGNSKYVGQLASDFSLIDQTGVSKSLSSYKGKWLVLYFYPKDGTPGCTTEAKNFRDAYQDFISINAEIVGISLDDNDSHKDFSKEYQLPFDILSDTEQKAAKQYGVLGGFGPVKYTKRQTFIIDPSGSIMYHFEKVNSKEHSVNVMNKLKELRKL